MKDSTLNKLLHQCSNCNVMNEQIYITPDLKKKPLEMIKTDSSVSAYRPVYETDGGLQSEKRPTCTFTIQNLSDLHVFIILFQTPVLRENVSMYNEHYSGLKQRNDQSLLNIFVLIECWGVGFAQPLTMTIGVVMRNFEECNKETNAISSFQ